MIDLVRKDMNVVVSRTFSKIYGLAGLRIGYLVAKPDLIKKISQYGGDFPFSQTAIAAAKASLGMKALWPWCAAKMKRPKSPYGSPG